MRSIYSDLMIKMLSGNKKIYIFFQISAVCIGVCAYMHTTFVVGEIAGRILVQLYTGNILLLTNIRESVFFCLLLKETCICFNNLVWQLLHRGPDLCLNIRHPNILCIFNIDPQNQASQKIVPLSKTLTVYFTRFDRIFYDMRYKTRGMTSSELMHPLSK